MLTVHPGGQPVPPVSQAGEFGLQWRPGSRPAVSHRGAAPLFHLVKPNKMNPPDPSWRKLNLLALAAVYWMTVHGAAWAQAAEPADEGGGGAGSWLLPYALVVLCVGLGMLFVCRSAKRRARAKPEEYKSAGLIHEDTEEASTGEYQPPGMRAAAAQRGSRECKEAKTALILALASLPCAPALAPIAIRKALQAKKMIKEDPRLTGDGMATAALIIAGVVLLPWVVLLLLSVLF